MGLFDLGWVLRFVNVVGCGLVVVVVLWSWQQFGGCGSDYWVVVVVIFWVVVGFFLWLWLFSFFLFFFFFSFFIRWWWGLGFRPGVGGLWVFFFF